MKYITALVLASTLFWVQPIEAKTPGGDGNDLLDNCQAAAKGETGARAGLCVGFVNAYRQIAVMLPNEKLLCLPTADISNEQFIRVLLKYLGQHPERLHLAATQLIYDSMQDAFPCPAESPGLPQTPGK